MGYFYVLVGLGVVVLVALLVSLRGTLKRRLQLPYAADATLLTASQRAFKGVLERAMGAEHQIYAKVHAIDVIGLQPRLPRAQQDLALRRLGDRRFDFLICSKETTAILCAVNLSPRSRLRKQPPKNALDRICAAARLPFVRFRESDVYSVAEIEERIFAAMQARGVPPRADESASDETAAMLHTLSKAIDGQPPVSRSRPTREKSTGADAHRTASPPPAAIRQESTPQRRLKRRDPTLRDHDHHIVDDGPSFKIGGDLDEDRPVRPRRGESLGGHR